MLDLKAFYQYKRELKKNNKFLKLKSGITSELKNTYPFKKFPINLSIQGILHIKSSFNNTLITGTDLKGKVLFVKSCGSLGFHGKKKRSTKFAIESTLEVAISKLKEYNFKKIMLHLNGFAKARFTVINSFKKSNIKIAGIYDITPIPHNGCRPKKLRRG